MTDTTIDTGDHVKHGPSGEEWLVARTNSLHLFPCGWPPTRADLADCTLIKKATPEERLSLLRDLADGQSMHSAWARSVLTGIGMTWEEAVNYTITDPDVRARLLAPRDADGVLGTPADQTKGGA